MSRVAWGGKVSILGGLLMPATFPLDDYEAAYLEGSRLMGVRDLHRHFGMSWASLAMRYRMVAEADAAFRSSLRLHGVNPAPEQRFHQESDLFTVFSGACSCLDSLSLAIHALASRVNPSAFRTDEAALRRVEFPTTAELLARHLPEADLSKRMLTARRSDGWSNLSRRRNVLVHRSFTSRLVFVGDPSHAETWRRGAERDELDVLVEPLLTSEPMAWLTQTVKSLVAEVAPFVAILASGPPVG